MLIAAARETPDVETASDSYARRFAGEAGRFLLAQQESAIRAVLDGWHGGSVLDVGGGHAQLTPLLKTLATDVCVLGSDTSSLKRIRQLHPDCAAVAGDLLRLPFASRTFDLVAAVRLLPHVRRWPRLLAELCRVARSIVVVDYPRPKGFNSLTPLLFPLKKRLEGDTREYRNFRDAEIDGVFAACGFEPTRREAELLLPLVLHRSTHGSAALRAVERSAKDLGLTQLLGSPVVLRADRLRAS
jgi:ubiquinone/menaquinone biosynthesis C-methylase UbiE